MLRIGIGLLAAALWLPLLAYATGERFAFFWFGMIAMFTIPLTLFVALPLVLLLRRHLSFVRCIAAGFGIGLLAVALEWSLSHWQAALNLGPLLIGAGVLSSLVFWLVGVWRNSRLPAHEGIGLP
jgi:hypothetical protein